MVESMLRFVNGVINHHIDGFSISDYIPNELKDPFLQLFEFEPDYCMTLTQNCVLRRICVFDKKAKDYLYLL